MFADDEVEMLAEHGILAEKISIRELFITPMNCKLKSAEAAERYKSWLDYINDGLGITSFDAVWEEVGRSGGNLRGHELEAKLIKGYAGENVMC